MNPKSIIIKTQSKDFHNALIYKLKEFKNIRFTSIKLNGFYIVIIKCHTYYNRESTLDETKLYGSYIFLYSIVSIILSELLICYHENSISKRIINKTQFTSVKIHKLSSISSLLLDEHSPFDFSEILYKKRKNILLNTLLHSFRKRNFIFTDYFIDFFAKEYLQELKRIIDVSIEILENKQLYDYMMNFVFKNKS